MNFVVLFIIVIAAFNLNKDFKRDPGLHKKAKIVHAIMITLLMLAYRGSFGRLGLLIGDTSFFIDKYYIQIGMFPDYVNFAFFLLELLLSIIILVLSFKMLNRNNTSRKFFIMYIPFLGTTTIFDFYRGWILQGNLELVSNNYLILAIGAIFMGGLTILYYIIYTSSWMKAFFNLKSDTPEDKIDLYE